MIPNVLLVDDDPLLLQGLVRSLAREPYNLYCACLLYTSDAADE